jgi:alkylation response protein AidB-like acyl-CoA dehydrogenase
VTAPAVATSLAAVTEVAFCDGLAAGIRYAFDPFRAVPCGAGGHTLLPVGYADRVRRWALPGADVPAEAATVAVLAHPLAAAEELELLRVTPVRPGSRTGPPNRDWAVPLVAIRLGVTRRLLALAVAHLGERRSNGTPLTGYQLVQANVADVATAIEACRHGLRVAQADPATAPASAAWMHARLDRADAVLSTMFGAAGYLRDHPARGLYVVALVRDAWIDPAPTAAGGEP